MSMFIKAVVAAIVSVMFATACVASMPEPQSFEPEDYGYEYAEEEDRAFFLATWREVWYEDLSHDEQLEYCWLWLDDPDAVTASLMESATVMPVRAGWIEEAFASTCGKRA